MCKSKKEGGLGFRELETFNQSLLAKQAWRLLDSPTSLLARVYKAKYFAKKDFLEAKIGARPSYAWRSIMFGKELLEKGLMRSIGDGDSTKIWMDKWLFDEVPRRPINKESHINLELKVSHLITADGNWDTNMLSSLFPPRDVVKIRSFPPDVELQDRYVWAYTKNGVYSVKSGNWLGNQPLMVETLSQSILAVNMTKERVWKLKTLPKIRLFLWRMLSGALAVSDCLRQHGVSTNPTCQICNLRDETILHVFFECNLAHRVWVLSGLSISSHDFSQGITENLNFLFDLMEKPGDVDIKLRSIPWILWGIWKNRNEVLYAGKVVDPHITLAHAFEEADHWFRQAKISENESKLNLVVRQREEKRWSNPIRGILKCNVHSSWTGSHYHFGGAWIIRDSTGLPRFHAHDAFLPVSNRVSAELLCILWTVRSLRDLRVRRFELWSDCSSAISALLEPHNWPLYRSVVDQILQVMSAFHSITFKTSLVSANSIARDIAKSVTKDGRFNSYLAMGGPAWLHNRIEEERRS